MNTATQSTEKRRFHRINFVIDAKLSWQQNSTDTSVHDLSLNGALIEQTPDWPAQIGDNAFLSFSLDGVDHNVEMEVTVAHIEADHIGLRCIHIDVDSISNLRRLVELNLGDSELLERDLHALIRD